MERFQGVTRFSSDNPLFGSQQQQPTQIENMEPNFSQASPNAGAPQAAFPQSPGMPPSFSSPSLPSSVSPSLPSSVSPSPAFPEAPPSQPPSAPGAFPSPSPSQSPNSLSSPPMSAPVASNAMLTASPPDASANDPLLQNLESLGIMSSNAQSDTPDFPYGLQQGEAGELAKADPPSIFQDAPKPMETSDGPLDVSKSFREKFKEKMKGLPWWFLIGGGIFALLLVALLIYVIYNLARPQPKEEISETTKSSENTKIEKKEKGKKISTKSDASTTDKDSMPKAEKSKDESTDVCKNMEEDGDIIVRIPNDEKMSIHINDGNHEKNTLNNTIERSSKVESNVESMWGLPYAADPSMTSTNITDGSISYTAFMD